MFGSTLRRVGVLMVVLSLAMVGAMSANGQAVAVKLFKMITAKDEVVIGLTGEELRSFGPRADLDNLAERLAAAGQITVWQYAVTRGADGALVQAPLRRVAVFKADTLRIEPYNPAPLTQGDAAGPGRFAIAGRRSYFLAAAGFACGRVPGYDTTRPSSLTASSGLFRSPSAVSGILPVGFNVTRSAPFGFL